MPTVYLSPGPPIQQFNQGGAPLAGGKLYTYLSNTVTKTTTWTDNTGTTANTNPVILDANGQCQVWLAAGTQYTYVLSPPGDTDPPTAAFWTVNGIIGQNAASPPGAYTQAFAMAPTAPASTTGETMQGIAGNIVPIRSGVVMVTFSGTMALPAGTAAGVGMGFQPSYGLGTPPANGAPVTGIQVGTFQEETAPATIGGSPWLSTVSGHALIGASAPLALGTLYWIDLTAIALVAPSVAALQNVYLTAVEL